MEDLPIVLILNAPSINTGLIDDVLSIKDWIEKRQKKDKIWIHIDGAFGMFFLPFLNEEDYKKIGPPISEFYESEKSKLDKLYFPHVNSISVDLHKMGLIPYPAGVILIKKEKEEKEKEKKDWELIRRRADYIAKHYDDTLSGSRSGAAVVSSYAAIRELGYDGYRKIIIECLRLTNEFLEHFRQSGDIFEIVGKPITNVFAVRFTKTFIKRLERNSKLEQIAKVFWRKKCVRDYNIVETPLEENYSHLNKQQQKEKEEKKEEFGDKIWRFTIMPHVTEAVLDNFIKILYIFIQEVRHAGP